MLAALDLFFAIASDCSAATCVPTLERSQSRAIVSALAPARVSSSAAMTPVLFQPADCKFSQLKFSTTH